MSPSAAAWCHSRPRAAQPLQRSRRPSESQVSAQKHREHEHKGNSVCALYLQLTLHGRAGRWSLRRSQRHVPSRGGRQSGSGMRSRRPEAAEGEMLLPEAWLAFSAAAALRSMVSRRRSEGHLGRSRPGCTGPVQRNTRSRGGGSVSRTLYTYPGLVSVSLGCFQRSLPLPQLGLLLQQLVDLPLHSLQLHRMQLERVLTCTQRYTQIRH